VILLLLVLIGTFVYYFVIIPANTKRRQQRRSRPIIPAEKTAVATENLEAIRAQLGQIQDEVTKQALLSRSREIEQNLKRGGLTIAVFGTGSAGKSSLINALVGRMVGEVGATMGTTTVGATHKLQLAGGYFNCGYTGNSGSGGCGHRSGKGSPSPCSGSGFVALSARRGSASVGVQTTHGSHWHWQAIDHRIEQD
jgi:Dynamin family